MDIKKFTECLQYKYPYIKKTNYQLADKGNINELHIATWSYIDYPRPSIAELEAVYPQVLKEQKIAELKSVYKKIVYKNHDIEDKIEALAGLKPAQEILEIKNWIKAVRYVFGQVKTQVNNAVDVVSVEAIDISYNTILGQVEAYYLSL